MDNILESFESIVNHVAHKHSGQEIRIHFHSLSLSLSYIYSFLSNENESFQEREEKRMSRTDSNWKERKKISGEV